MEKPSSNSGRDEERKEKEESAPAPWRSGAVIVTDRIRSVLEAAALAMESDAFPGGGGIGRGSAESARDRSDDDWQQVRDEVQRVLSCHHQSREKMSEGEQPPAHEDLPGIRASTLLRCCQLVRSQAGESKSAGGTSHGPLFHQVIRGSGLVVPEQLRPRARVRPRELEERLKRLREEQWEREYEASTASLHSKAKLEETTFAEWRLPIAFGGSVILTMFGLFAFGFQTGKAVSGGNDAVAALLGALFSTAGLLVETILFGIRDHRNLHSSARVDSSAQYARHLKTS